METVFWLVDISVYVGGKYKGFLGNWFLMKKMKEFFRGGEGGLVILPVAKMKSNSV